MREQGEHDRKLAWEEVLRSNIIVKMIHYNDWIASIADKEYREDSQKEGRQK